jgi:hypothetical protein
MLDEYQMFITGLATREKIPTFEELIGILMKEGKRRNNLNRRSTKREITLQRKTMKKVLTRKATYKTKSRQGTTKHRYKCEEEWQMLLMW